MGGMVKKGPAKKGKTTLSKKRANARRKVAIDSRGLFTAAEFKALFRSTGKQCAYCRRPLTLQTTTIDHIIPISRGGSNMIDNIAPACSPCNKKKANSIDPKWTPFWKLP